MSGLTPNSLAKTPNVDVARETGAGVSARGKAGDFREVLGDELKAGSGDATATQTKGETPADPDPEERRKKGKAVAVPCAAQIEPPVPSPLLLAFVAADDSCGDDGPPYGSALPPESGNANELLSADPAPRVENVEEPGGPGGPAAAKLAFAARLMAEARDQPQPAGSAPLRSVPEVTPIPGMAAVKPLVEEKTGRAGNIQKPEFEDAPQPSASRMEFTSQVQTGKAPNEMLPAKAVSSPPAATISEAVIPADRPAAIKSEPAREISLVVPGRKQDGVEVRVVERAGEVHVSVRTPDAELARDLRQDLNQLVTRMEEKGYHTETWRPMEAAGSSFPNRRDDRDASGEAAGRDSGKGSHRDGSQQRDSNQQQRDRPRWLEELEQTFEQKR